MKQIWKKVLVFVMIVGTVSTSLAQTETRATLFVAGFIETITRLLIIPRQNTVSNLDLIAGGNTVVADFYIETNTDQNFNVNAWSVNGNSGLCDGSQPNGGPVYDPTSAVGAANCIPYTMTWTTTDVTSANLASNTDAGAVTLAQGIAGTQVVGTYVATAGSPVGTILGTVAVDPTPAGTEPAGRYDDTIVFQLEIL